MLMVRRYNKKSVRRAPTTWYNKKYSVGDIASKAYSGVKALAKLVNSEEFQLDSTTATTTAANVAVIFGLQSIAQGDGQSGRTGNSILVSKIHRTEYVTATATVLVRELLVRDMQQVADSAPSITDVLESSVPTALYNKLSKSRFQIIEDKMYVMNTANNPNKLIRNTIMCDKHILFNGAATTDIQKGGYWKMLISDGAVTFSGSYRMFYHDN